jgi:hypothetical protein
MLSVCIYTNIVLGPLLFIIYINDLPKILEASSMPVLFADDASVLYSHSDPLQFKNKLYEVYGLLDDWFKKNLLSLSTGKTHCINFTTNNKVERDIGKLGALVRNTNHIKFLGLTIECSLSWERHIDEITQKLSLAGYMIRNIKPFMSLNTLKIFIIPIFIQS